MTFGIQKQVKIPLKRNVLCSPLGDIPEAGVHTDIFTGVGVSLTGTSVAA